jgi:hypothetical protein
MSILTLLFELHEQLRFSFCSLSNIHLDEL